MAEADATVLEARNRSRRRLHRSDPALASCKDRVAAIPVDGPVLAN